MPEFSKSRILLDLQADASSVVKTNMQMNANVDNNKEVSASSFSTNGINKKMISTTTCNAETPNTLPLVKLQRWSESHDISRLTEPQACN